MILTVLYCIVFARLIRAVNRKLQSLVSGGMAHHDAWNICSVELVKATEVGAKYLLDCFRLF